MGSNYYKYGGTDFTLPEPPARRKVPTAPFDPSLCGTNAGYHQHYRYRQEQCEPCAQAHRAYDVAYRAKRKAA